MKTIVDVYLSFPMSEYIEDQLEELYKACGSMEAVEEAFDIEFSCGDNKYLSDIEDDMEELDKYDGKVCTNCVPRERHDGKEFKPNKVYNFQIKYSEQNEEVSFYLNGELTLRKCSYNF